MSDLPPPPGWYPDPVMPGTQRYWDGTVWSDHVAPAGPATRQSEPAKSSGLGPLTIAFGILIAAGVIWFIYSVATANDAAECAMDNADRAMAGEPTKDCD